MSKPDFWKACTEFISCHLMEDLTEDSYYDRELGGEGFWGSV